MLQSTNGSHDDQIPINNRKVEEYCLLRCDKLFTKLQSITPQKIALLLTLLFPMNHMHHIIENHYNKHFTSSETY